MLAKDRKKSDPKKNGIPKPRSQEPPESGIENDGPMRTGTAVTVPAPADPIPADAFSDADRAHRAAGGVPLSVLAQLMGARGAAIEHKGGAIPTLRFDSEGCAHVVRFLGRSKPGDDADAEYDLLNFDVLDPESFDPIRDPEAKSARVLFRANITESWALEKYYGATDDEGEARDNPVKIGNVAAISYHGEQPTKRGQAPMKLYTVHGFSKA